MNQGWLNENSVMSLFHHLFSFHLRELPNPASNRRISAVFHFFARDFFLMEDKVEREGTVNNRIR